ncbi:MAG: tRNA (N6-isopentenyl adenosine(37)-C2)-methylthiotransferase MiaB [Cellulosilyticaceae bacterium]
MGKRQVIDVSTHEAMRQNEIIETLSEKIKGKGLKYCVSTFGCQMNAHDSEKIEGMLEQIGYEKTDNENQADFVLYNTCCVRENAEMKIYGRLGFLKTIKQKNPNMMIALCGCMMQQDIVLDTLKKKYKFVDIIFGTYNIYKLPELIQTRLESKHNVIDIWDSHQDIVEDLPSTRKYSFKSCVNIMYGCNNFCTYCIVPYVRGRERSREKDDIIKEVTQLVNDGVKEVMLLGQNVNSYGKNLDNPVSFAELLRAVNEVPGIERVRFMTSHPKDLSDELIAAMTECDKVCNSIHLPIQSGSTNMLNKMNRHYTKESYLELVAKLKKAMPTITLTTDIIVGFPGETEEDFKDTLDIIKQVKFGGAFTFIYSKRTGTPAATMDNQIEDSVIKDRFNRLLAVVNEVQYDYMQQHKGNTYKILVEDQSKSDENIVSGRTSQGDLVHVKGSTDLIGQFVTVKITDFKTHYLVGELTE